MGVNKPPSLIAPPGITRHMAYLSRLGNGIRARVLSLLGISLPAPVPQAPVPPQEATQKAADAASADKGAKKAA